MLFIRLSFFVLIALALPVTLKRMTGGFRLEKMKLEFPFQETWEAAPPSADIKSILNQPFSYLSRGAQCYVFVSQDDRYVVKLFRYDQAKSPFFQRKPKKTDFNTKINTLFEACKLAYDLAREETALVWIHLNPTPMDLPILQCKDAIGRKYPINLNTSRFAIQKKVKSFSDSFQVENIKEVVDSFIALLKARTEKGIYNRDPNLERNFGFLGKQAVEIDFGNYGYSPDLDKPKEMKRYIDKLRAFLLKYFPETVDYLDEL